MKMIITLLLIFIVALLIITDGLTIKVQDLNQQLNSVKIYEPQRVDLIWYNDDGTVYQQRKYIVPEYQLGLLFDNWWQWEIDK